MEDNEIDIPSLFGKNVQKYRKQLGLTQSELSKRLEITQKHLSIIETGTQFASASLIAKISKELNVSPAVLFGQDMKKNDLERLRRSIIDELESKMNQMYLDIISQIQSKGI